MIEPATLADAEAVLSLQKRAYQQEAQHYRDFQIPPLTQSLEETLYEFENQTVLKLTFQGTLVGSVRGYVQDHTCYIGKLMVEPSHQNKGLGKQLMQAIEDYFRESRRFELFTGHESQKNLFLYQKLGYQIFKQITIHERLKLMFLEKWQSKDTQSSSPRNYQ